MARFAAVAVAAAAPTSACASGCGTTGRVTSAGICQPAQGGDRGVGDSVGYGLTTVGNVIGRLAEDGRGCCGVN